MGVNMIVKKAFRPGGSGSKEIQPGSPFVASSEAQAKLWRAIGFCEDAPAEPPAPKPFVPPPYVRRDQKAEESTDTEPAKKTTRRYQRRDLTAKTED